MKGLKKCCGRLLVLLITFLLSLSVYSNTSAIVYNTSQYKTLSFARLFFGNGGSIYIGPQAVNGGAYVLSSLSNASGFQYLALAFSGTIPARSIITVNIETRFSNIYPQMGWTTHSAAYSLLNASYGDYGMESLTFYVDQDVTGEIDLFPAEIDSGQTSSITMKISPISYTTLSFEPTWDQLNEISAKLTTSNGNLQLIRGKLDDILTFMQEQVEAQEEQQQQEQQDRDNIEDQSSEIDSGASDLSDDVSQESSNIISHASDILGALNTSPTDCVISVTTGSQGALQLSNMNLCQAPSSILSLIQNISTIVVALAVLWLGYTVVQTTLYLINDIVGGNN